MQEDDRLMCVIIIIGLLDDDDESVAWRLVAIHIPSSKVIASFAICVFKAKLFINANYGARQVNSFRPVEEHDLKMKVGYYILYCFRNIRLCCCGFL